MRILDRIRFTASFDPLTGQPFAAYPPGGIDQNAVPQQVGVYPDGAPLFGYTPEQLDDFTALPNPDMHEELINRHWYQIGAQGVGATRDGDGVPIDPIYFDYGTEVPHHLIYSYLVENTGLFHAFRELINQFQNSERLSKAPLVGPHVQNIMHSAEQLFFKDWGGTSTMSNLTSMVRPSSVSVRANAYHRLLGLKLNWNPKYSEQPVAVGQPDQYNGSFVASFERVLKLFWEVYINAQNQTGPNVADTYGLQQSIADLRIMLMTRRSSEAVFTPARYSRYNLSRVEYYSVVQAYWLQFILSPRSPLALYAQCDANTAGDVLLQLGARLKVPVHSKSVAILDMAPAIAHLLRAIEAQAIEGIVVNIARAAAPAPVGNPALMAWHTLILSVIHNWEITTGSDIKGERQRTLQRA